jgi:hypothetical protein
VVDKVHSHYDNLKVSRDAPPEVIRAAYKALAQKYHPDRRPNDARAIRVTKILNGSYAVLSDPAQRQEHDEWLDRKEREAAAEATAKTPPPPPQPEPEASPRSTAQPRPGQRPQAAPSGPSGAASPFAFAASWKLWLPLIVVGIGIVVWLMLQTPGRLFPTTADFVPEQSEARLLPPSDANREPEEPLWASTAQAGTPSSKREYSVAPRASRPVFAPNGMAQN